MANVNFYKGTEAQYTGLKTKDAYTFYLVENESTKNLYLGEIKISNASDLAAAIVKIAANEEHIGDISTLTTTQKSSLVKAINEIKSEVSALAGGETGGISEMIKAVTGDLTTLTTEAKGTIVAAINELNTVISTNKKIAIVKISSEKTTTGMLKSYTFTQGDEQIGVIDIPKDMVIKSGEVVTNPEGQDPGTYIVLTLANAEEDKIYVNVGTLVDLYTAKPKATKIQLSIDTATREISADIVADSITATDLATNAVTTAKITDKNVTKAKLADAVQSSLNKADTAIQSIAESTVNGNILVDSKEVKVHGLGTAAYTASGAYDAAGSANAVKTAIIGTSEDTSTANTIQGVKKYIDEAIAAAKIEWKTLE